MKPSYRNERNARSVAAYWGKSVHDKGDWYEIKAISEDETEIMFYDVIGWPFVDAAEFVRAMKDVKTPILARINSPGGDVFDAMAIFNVLQSHPYKVTTRIESLAASAASFIALAGKEVQAYQNAMMMIHEPSAVVWGNQHDMRETADILAKVNDNMIDIYAANTDLGKREVAALLKAETWLTAKEAKDKGFIDTIIDGKSAKAQFDLSMFAHCPECFQGMNHQPTEREKEKALRDVGFTLKEAKAFLAGRREGDSEVIAACQKTLNIFGGR